jgi:prolyl-tRNA synthetase
MKFSRMFIPTLRESPSEAEAISHKLMLRAGYIRQLASGLYIFLPLGWRVLNRINRILKEEMESIGAQEISMPILHPAEIWQKTGRWYDIKDEMFRLKDRTGRDMCLGMTHEEIMTWLASKEIRSYRQLPQIWYQIQTKLRDEARPKSGVLRTREFIMKDSYSFDIDDEGLHKSYEAHAEAYHRIFKRCGIKFYQVESDPGMMGGAQSHEFMAPSNAGEDYIILCDNCNYAANIEIARSISPRIKFYDWTYEEIYTPQKKTVQEVSTFLNIQPEYFIKSLLYITAQGPVLILLRGDQELHEKKLIKLIGPFRSALKDEVINYLGTEPGFIGPMGHKIPIIADLVLKDGSYITGANKKDFHVKGIRAGVHFDCQWEDIHIVKEGDLCPNCNSLIRIEKAIEIGNIFKLGTKYSVSLDAFFLDKDGIEQPIIMGSYGIGPARIAAAAIEQNYDKDGIIWPKSIAPFDLEIIPLNTKDHRTMKVSENLYNSLKNKGFDILIDDRDERPGVKFKDADLIGIPLQIIIGEKNLKNDQIEIKIRRSKESNIVSLEKATDHIIDVSRNIE